METECRKEFEKWAINNAMDIAMDGIIYASSNAYFAWIGWRAAWHYLKGHDET